MMRRDSDEFLEQCETEAFLKFNSCFSTDLRYRTNPRNKIRVHTRISWVCFVTQATFLLNLYAKNNKFKNYELKP